VHNTYFHLFSLAVTDILLLNVISWAITAIGTASFWFVPKHPLGWMFAITAQLLYIPYSAINHEWGFLAHAICFSSAFMYNFIYDERHPRVQKLIAEGKRKPAGKVHV